MKTKQEVILEHPYFRIFTDESTGRDSIDLEHAEDSMQVYADQQSIKFAEYLACNYKPITICGELKGWKISYQNDLVYSTQEIYNMFISVVLKNEN